MPKLIMLPLIFTLSSVFLSAQLPIPPDTLVSVFHHNYLVERHAELQQFADELMLYSLKEGISEETRRAVAMYRTDVYALEVWKSEDVVSTKNTLDYLLNQGTLLRNKLVKNKISNLDWPLITGAVVLLMIGFLLGRYSR
ncbi:hypothetical protein [Lewinella cohaerens]|uniref:hypothetical protein n=1 Tax=Lewinella cohaerens TaxID=70995 RepID=UPI0003608ABA|nr:hypothetical protein [Lewinella cohaerens]